MSRRSKSNGSTSTVANTKNISHPNEFLQDHRQFLNRSLERNDTDMAALTDLNRSLHERKQAIIDTCGEITLLDLGSGKYKLSPTGDSLEEAGAATATDNEKDKEPTKEKEKEHSDTFPDEAGQELCVDFLLRMKLRRKLLNRLARRLNRVAHAMDGEDVSPPGPPKYGDLRLHVDPAQVQASEAHWQRQEAARRQLDQEREKHIYADQEEEETKRKWSTDQEEEHRLKYVSDDEKEKAKAKAQEEAPSEKETSTSTDAKAAPLDQEEKSQEGTNNDKVKEKDGEPKEQADAKAAEGKESAEGETVKEEVKMEEDEKPDAAASEKAISPIKKLFDNVDYEALQEYSDSYEKVLDPATGTFTYTILDQDREEDHLAIKYGAGIGASHRSMSSKDKEAEWKRWQTSLLSRIPEQPTFEELGYQNRVFLMEERRKLALEDLKAKTTKVEDIAMGDASPEKTSEEDKDESPTKASDEEKEDSPKKTSKEKDDDDTNDEEKDNDDMEVDEKDSADDAGSDDDKKDEEDKKVDDIEALETDHEEKAERPSKKAEEDEEEEDEDEKKADIVPKRNRPISLVPVPSFYEQDLKRIKLVHAELMAASIQDHARRRLEEVTRDYNGALQTSNEAFERRQQVQNKLNSFVYENRGQMSKIQNEYSVEVAIAKNRWNKQRQQFEHHKLDKMLPSRWGRTPSGTQATRNYAARHDQLSTPVASCLADIIDSVDLISMGKLQNEKFQEPYNCPAPPNLGNAIVDQESGETAMQRQQRIEASLRQEVNAVAVNLRTSEDERQRAWKKMLKTKAEFDLPTHQVTNMNGGRIHVDLNNYHVMALPALQASAQQNIPQEAASKSMVPSYAPVRSYTATLAMAAANAAAANNSDSKYSAARVRERISADGSVAPVTEPKKTKDGLYQRPAGRTRKGMEWDALRGIWVPARQFDMPFGPGGPNM